MDKEKLPNFEVMQVADKEILRRIKEKVLENDPTAEVILFGSRARGDARSESDWDILILLNLPEVSIEKKRELRYPLIDVEMDTEQSFSVLIHSRKEWETKYAPTPFYKNVKKEGVVI